MCVGHWDAWSEIVDERWGDTRRRDFVLRLMGEDGVRKERIRAVVGDALVERAQGRRVEAANCGLAERVMCGFWSREGEDRARIRNWCESHGVADGGIVWNGGREECVELREPVREHRPQSNIRCISRCYTHMSSSPSM